MKTLNVELDRSQCDVISIEKYLAGYDASLSIYTGNFTAGWLLSDIHSDRWIITTPKTIAVNGEYKYVKHIIWHKYVADGTYLDDPENAKVLIFLQKVLFILIESNSIMPNAGVSSIEMIHRSLMSLISWAFREDVQLNIKDDVLLNITYARVRDYISESIYGTTFITNGYDKLIIKSFADLTGYTIKSRDILKLNQGERKKIEAYLKGNGFYKTNFNGLKYVCRAKFCEIFKISTGAITTHKLSLFLRQFELDFINYNTDVLTPTNNQLEYPSHKTPLINDVYNQIATWKSVCPTLRILGEIFKLRPLFKDSIPEIENFRLGKLIKYAHTIGKDTKTTRWLPLPVCLKTFNRSIEFILNKSDDLLDCLEELYEELDRNNLFRKNLSEPDYRQKRNITEKIFPKYQTTRNVDSLSRKDSSYVKGADYFIHLRTNPCLADLIEMLKASCLIIIAGLKPIRINELSSLKYKCLYFKENDGFWMMQDIEKSGIEGILPEDARPVPQIAAKAITVLQRINDHACKYAPSKEESKYLLYALDYTKNRPIATIKDDAYIYNVTNKFCDYIETPLDKFGRRWYINIHELRKSFLLTFFWTFKFSSLDSCRWIACHKNPEHVFSYIEANIPGEEMVEVEAEYSYQQLRLFSSENNLSDIENIEELNNNVCEHFNVKSISELSEAELKEWLAHAIKSKNYEIHVYGINSLNPENNVTVAVKIT